jgi:hypothetical protein
VLQQQFLNDNRQQPGGGLEDDPNGLLSDEQFETSLFNLGLDDDNESVASLPAEVQQRAPVVMSLEEIEAKMQQQQPQQPPQPPQPPGAWQQQAQQIPPGAQAKGMQFQGKGKGGPMQGKGMMMNPAAMQMQGKGMMTPEMMAAKGKGMMHPAMMAKGKGMMMHPGMQGKGMPGLDMDGKGKGMQGKGMVPQMMVPRSAPMCGTLMNNRDVQYVVSSQLRQLHSAGGDPHVDDFYYQHWLRKMRAASAAAAGGGVAAPPSSSMPLPLPSWKSEKAKKTEAEAAKALAETEQRELTSTWEKKHSVLGHCAKTSISRPRQLLAVPKAGDDDVTQTITEQAEDAKAAELGDKGRWADGIDSGEKYPTFAGSRWAVRLAVEKGYRALFLLQDIMRLLGAQPQPKGHQAKEMKQQSATLLQSLGQVMGLAEGGSATVDGGRVAALLSAPKGARLIAQTMPLLSVDKQRMLLPSLVLALMLQDPLPVVLETPKPVSKAVCESECRFET